jgi:hypothetical protein
MTYIVQDMEKWKPSYIASGNVKTVEKSLKKSNIESLYDPTVSFSRELKKYVHTKTCTQLFLTTLFITAKIWK